MKHGQPLKIGFVFDDSLDSLDGVAQYVKRLGKYYKQAGHEVQYLVGETKAEYWYGGKIYSLSKNIRVNFNGNSAGIPLPANTQKIGEVLKLEKFDILHVQMPYSPFMAGRVIKLASPKTVIIGTFHVAPLSNFVRISTKFLGIISRSSLKKFDSFYSVSSAANAFAKQSFHIHTKISPNVINLEEFKTEIVIHKDKRINIVFLGRLVKRKGALELLKAFSSLRSKMPNIKLTIAGRGPLLKELQNFIDRHGLKKDVELLGFIEEKDKPGVLATADIACFPATGGESFGIVLIEAMASGAGVTIAGNNSGYISVLGSMPECLFNPNRREIENCLMKFIEDKKLRDQTHQRQKKLVEQFDVKIVGSKMLEEYFAEIANKQKNRNNYSDA